jgi:pantoate kinase
MLLEVLIHLVSRECPCPHRGGLGDIVAVAISMMLWRSLPGDPARCQVYVASIFML